MLLVPMSDILINTMKLSSEEFGVLAAAYPLSSFLSSMIGVFILDKYERKATLLITYSFFTVGCYLSAYLPTFANHDYNFYALLFSRCFTGIFGGVISALVLSIVSDLIPKERRASAMGIVMAAFSLAVAFGVPLGRFLANSLNWQTPFLLVGTLSSFFFLTVLAFIPPIKAHLKTQKDTPWQVIKNVFQKRSQWSSLLFMMFIVIGKFSLVPFIAVYMVHNMGFSATEVPIIYFLGGVISVLVTPLIGQLSDRVGRKNAFYFLAFISIFPLFAMTSSTPNSVFSALLVTSSFFTFMNGRMVPVNAMISSVPEAQYRGGFMSMSAAAQSLATALASIIAGYIVIVPDPNSHDKLIHFEYVGYIAILCTLMAIMLAKYVESRVM
jgi:predicted MFS family arabinose efflux permease